MGCAPAWSCHCLRNTQPGGPFVLGGRPGFGLGRRQHGDYHRPVQRRGVLFLLGGCCGGPAWAADALPRVTLVDGAATLTLGARPVRAAVGVALPAGTLVDTAEACQLLRIEWPDGSALDLGGATRLMLAPPPLPALPAGAFYLLQGFAKFSAAAPGHGWAAPLLAAAPAPGVAVVSVDATSGDTLMFAESGAWRLTERHGNAHLALAAGNALHLAPGQAAEPLMRAPADWLPRLPRAFRDTLPLRLAGLAEREVPPEALPPPRYADLQPWLTAEAALRHDFPRRFAQRLVDGEFRATVKAHLRQHPEWSTLLEPPKPKQHL